MKKLLSFLLAISLCSLAYPTTITRPNNYTAGTVIDPTQVNNNETTIYNDYNGSIDNTNIKSNGVNFSNLSTAIQQLWNYRRPVLVYASASTVSIESGLNGTAGQVLIVFTDGTTRTDSTASHITLDVTRVASLSGTKQSGLRTGSVSNNTSYAVYAVKATDNSTDFVAVADTVLPIPANFSTLNSNFGANGWIYLGMIRYGDNGSTGNVILNFFQTGNVTKFINAGTGGSAVNCPGYLVAEQVSGTTLSYTYAAGTGASQIPNNATNIIWTAGATGNTLTLTQQSVSTVLAKMSTSSGAAQVISPASGGITVTNQAGNPADIWVSGFVDAALGIGPNPQF